MGKMKMERKNWMRRLSVFKHALLGCVLFFTVTSARAQTDSARSEGRCNRECLTNFVHIYVDALLKHDPSQLPVTVDVRFSENRKGIALGEGLWKTITSLELDGPTVPDPVSQQVAHFGAVKDGDELKLLMVRLKVDGQKISEIETWNTGPALTGGGFIPNLQLLTIMKPFFERKLSPVERRDRASLIAAANGYFEALQEHTDAVVAFYPGVNRNENGFLTTNNPNRSLGPVSVQESFHQNGFAYMSAVSERRIEIADPETGLVVGIVFLDVPNDNKTREENGRIVAASHITPNEKPRSNYQAEMFKVVNGEIRLIQAFMCGNEPFGSTSGWR
jgi:hypothetical protein